MGHTQTPIPSMPPSKPHHYPQPQPYPIQSLHNPFPPISNKVSHPSPIHIQFLPSIQSLPTHFPILTKSLTNPNPTTSPFYSSHGKTHFHPCHLRALTLPPSYPAYFCNVFPDTFLPFPDPSFPSNPSSIVPSLYLLHQSLTCYRLII